MKKMHYDFNEEEAKKMALAKDDGLMTLVGMDLFIANYNGFKLDCCSNDGLVDAVQYLTNTFLECIDSMDFQEWVEKGNDDGRPVIMSDWKFKSFFKEISDINASINGMCDDIAIIYEQDWWIFGDYVATTFYKDDFKRLDMNEIERAMASFNVLLDLNAVTQERKEKFIKRINQASNNLIDNALGDTSNISSEEIFKEVDRLLGMGYQSGLHEEWDI